MKIIKINEFDKNSILERVARGARETFDEDQTPVTFNGKVVDKEQVDLEKLPGKKANENGSHGAFDVDRPTEEDAKAFDDKKVWSENLENVWDCIVSESNFFIQGEAGWAKTDIITQMAKKCGYHVITVYLDKTLPEDLDGLTATKEYTKPDGSKGIEQMKALPVWAQYMLDNSDKKFLLFFDELNQANNDVMKALMPICHPHKRTICNTQFTNYFVGAAGNMSYENDLENIPRPLMARLGGRPIAWICGTDKDPKKAKEAWDDAFEYLHKKWDPIISKKVVDIFNKYRQLFASPRDIEIFIFEYIEKYKKNTEKSINKERLSMRGMLRIITSQTLSVEGTQYDNESGNILSKEQKEWIKEMAEICYSYIMGNPGRNIEEKPKNKNEKPSAGPNSMNNERIERYVAIAKTGTCEMDTEDGKQIIVPVTHETIVHLFDEMSAIAVQVLDRRMKELHSTWKYSTNQDALDSGKFSKELIDEIMSI